LQPLIASIATLALNSGLWVWRLPMGGSPFLGRFPASEVNDGRCPEKPYHLTLPGDAERSLAVINYGTEAMGIAKVQLHLYHFSSYCSIP
jgi:hypothetical protein